MEILIQEIWVEGAECQSKQLQGIWLLPVMDHTLSSKDLDKRTCCWVSREIMYRDKAIKKIGCFGLQKAESIQWHYSKWGRKVRIGNKCLKLFFSVLAGTFHMWPSLTTFHAPLYPLPQFSVIEVNKTGLNQIWQPCWPKSHQQGHYDIFIINLHYGLGMPHPNKETAIWRRGTKTPSAHLILQGILVSLLKCVLLL